MRKFLDHLRKNGIIYVLIVILGNAINFGWVHYYRWKIETAAAAAVPLKKCAPMEKYICPGQTEPAQVIPLPADETATMTRSLPSKWFTHDKNEPMTVHEDILAQLGMKLENQMDEAGFHVSDESIRAAADSSFRKIGIANKEFLKGYTLSVRYEPTQGTRAGVTNIQKSIRKQSIVSRATQN